MMFRSLMDRLLDYPLVYNLMQFFLAPASEYFLKRNFQSFFPDSKGLVLDVGCGPRLNTPYPRGIVMGVDLNFKNIRQYSSRRFQSGLVASGDHLPFKENSFDESRTFGFLHHMPKEKAILAIREMIRCTNIGGRVIILDSVWPKDPWMRPLAWLNLRLDRGPWMLSEEELADLVQEAYPSVWEKHRFTYTLVGHEAVALIMKKEGDQE